MTAVKNILGGKQNSYQAQGVDPAQLKTAYNQTQEGIKQQQDFVNALNAQNGLTNQSNVYNQLQGVVAGTGPNPAQAMLNNATGQNASNQAALMATQRGASANTGLIARQSAQQGANIQQQAVGQGAALQANQSLNAMGMAGNLANQQVGQQAQGIQNLNQFGLQQQGQLMGLQQNVNSVNAGVSAANAAAQGNMIGQLAGAAGTAIAGPAGGLAAQQVVQSQQQGANGSSAPPGMMVAAEGGQVPQIQPKGPRSAYGKMFAHGGEVPALVSPGEVYLKPEDVKQVAAGKKSPLDGEKIPGKAKVSGAKNSYANDTVPKTLESGGVVIPRSVTQAKNAPDKAAAFVKAVLSKSKLPRK